MSNQIIELRTCMTDCGSRNMPMLHTHTHTHTQSRSSSGIKEDVIAAVPPYGGRNARRKLSRDVAVEDTAIPGMEKARRYSDFIAKSYCNPTSLEQKS